MYICEFCNNEFATKSSLKLHQSKASYCILIQQNKGIIKDVIKYSCKYCKKEFTQKNRYKDHETICKDKPNENLLKINELEEQIKILKEKNIKLEADKEHLSFRI